jgi:hypothetical protein
MMVLAGYFLVAAIAVIAASAMIGLVLTKLMIRRFTKADSANQSCIRIRAKRGAGNSQSSLETSVSLTYHRP